MLQSRLCSGAPVGPAHQRSGHTPPDEQTQGDLHLGGVHAAAGHSRRVLLPTGVWRVHQLPARQVSARAELHLLGLEPRGRTGAPLPLGVGQLHGGVPPRALPAAEETQVQAVAVSSGGRLHCRLLLPDEEHHPREKTAGVGAHHLRQRDHLHLQHPGPAVPPSNGAQQEGSPSRQKASLQDRADLVAAAQLPLPSHGG